MGTTIKRDIDLGYDALQRFVEDEGDYSVKVGLLKETDSEITHYRGFINEFGDRTANIPPRPAHRDTFDENYKDYVFFVAAHLQQDPDEWDSKELFEELGQEHTNRLVDAIDSWSDPPNAPFTQRKKGFDDPLIETMETIGSIDFQVSDDR